TDSTAAISSSDNGAFTFTRTGSTTAPLTVKFALSGTAVKWIDYRRPEGDMPVEFTIPAGSASAVMNIVALANVTNASPETAIVTLAPDAAYTVGTQQSGALAILSTGSTGVLGGTGTGGCRVEQLKLGRRCGQFHGARHKQIQRHGQWPGGGGAIGRFQRRPLYAPLITHDLRIANSLVLQLAAPVADGQTVEVTNADG